MSAPDLRSTVLFDKALGCIAGAALGDAAGSAAKGADCGSGPDSGGGVAFGGHGSRAGLAFGGHGDETAMVEIVARMLVNTGGGATLDDWARAMRDNSPQFGKDSVFFISVQQVFSAVGRSGYPPRYTGLGTMPHSTGAVAMGPVGIVNACNPWQAALQAYELATMLHVYDVGFCQDGAAAVAAAVAAACRKDATVASVLDAAVDVILPLSGTEMAGLIRQARQLARRRLRRFRDLPAAATVGFARWRWTRARPFPWRWRSSRWPRARTAAATVGFARCPGGRTDPRETVPVALAIFALAEGDVQQADAACALEGCALRARRRCHRRHRGHRERRLLRRRQHQPRVAGRTARPPQQARITRRRPRASDHGEWTHQARLVNACTSSRLIVDLPVDTRARLGPVRTISCAMPRRISFADSWHTNVSLNKTAIQHVSGSRCISSR